MSHKRIKVRAKDLKCEEGAKELAESPSQRPYIDLFVALQKNQDPLPFIQKITDLPLEQRYTWRIVAALKWGFADFDSETIKVDLKTLSPTDLEKFHEALPPFRTYQFCKFLVTIFGLEKAKAILAEAVGQIEAPSETPSA